MCLLDDDDGHETETLPYVVQLTVRIQIGLQVTKYKKMFRKSRFRTPGDTPLSQKNEFRAVDVHHLLGFSIRPNYAHFVTKTCFRDV